MIKQENIKFVTCNKSYERVNSKLFTYFDLKTSVDLEVRHTNTVESVLSSNSSFFVNFAVPLDPHMQKINLF